MKRIFNILLLVGFLFGLSACSKNNEQVAETDSSDSQQTVVFSTLSTDGDFLSGLAEELEKRFTDLGYKFELASADFNPTKQIEQIENFITLGVDEIVVMAVDPSSLSGVLQKAKDNGIKIVAFSQKTSEYDVFLGADETKVGEEQAKMAAKWIDEKFPDATPGSIEVAVFENRDKPTAAERSDGLKKITEFSKKAKIVKTVGVDTSTEGGQVAAENLLLTNPEIKVILSYNADTAMGVDAYVMSQNSPVKDKANFATFAVDFNPAAADAIKKSVENESIWRGTIMLGSGLEAMYENIVTHSVAALDGTIEEKDDYTELSQITPENVESH